ncbi:MAG: hypothetical protein ROZ37_14990 [Aromatoleum sp.]|jgi:hypothetical protein|uniref:hypothetical protein n=1 Tax=Aromatoleum sp. TaxID=2307007 RepID=UPI0028953269|nr:hypothetical protein [Aromatoleum sp.]MDT3671625.1 hypothetical protein [Aromatoleum sp.]
MQRYKNLNGRSGIVAFEIGDDCVKIVFRDNPKVYLYSTRKIPPQKIERMKQLATAGRGLATFISRNPDVRDGYS